MRAMFGLVSLLVVIAIMMVIFKNIEAPTLQTGKKAQDQTRQISGRGQDGRAAIDSFKTEAKFRGGNRLEGLIVTSVTPGGALADYGLHKGDQIIEINGSKVGDISNDDPETAKALVHQAYQGSQPIVVLRDGQQVTLPAAPGTAGAVQQNGQPPQNTAVQNQLNNLTNSLKTNAH